MKVLDFLDQSAISLELKSSTKVDTINELVDLLYSQDKLKDREAVVAALLEREKLGSTGIGQGIAIPHCRCAGAPGLVAALGVSKRGVDFESLDREPVYLIFLLVSPLESSPQHLKALASISRLLKDKFFRQALKEAKSAQEVEKVIREEDEF